MIPILSLQELKKTLTEKTIINCKYAICILFLNPKNNSPAQQQITTNLEYFHYRSGVNIDFYIPGTGFNVSDLLLDLRKAFSTELFVQFIVDFEKESRWKYHGGTQLVIIPFTNGVFNYSRVIDINLDKVRVISEDSIIDQFFEGLIKIFSDKSKDNNMRITGLKYVLNNNGWNIVASFIKKDLPGIIGNIGHSMEIYSQFKIKDLRQYKTKMSKFDQL